MKTLGGFAELLYTESVSVRCSSRHLEQNRTSLTDAAPFAWAETRRRGGPGRPLLSSACHEMSGPHAQKHTKKKKWLRK